MIRGMQTAVSAMRTQLAKQEVLERNLLNLMAPGFKREGVAVDGFSATICRTMRYGGGSNETSLGQIGTATAVARPFVDFRQGELQQTGRQLDVALDGDGFLRLRTREGEVYWRGGPLRIDGRGALVTMDGYPILSEEGEVMPGEGSITIGGDGTIFVDGEPVERLSLVEFLPGTRMAKVGEGLYSPDDPTAPGPTEAAATRVMGGFLEGSNVDHIATMSEMMLLLRAYTASQRMLQAQDQLLGKAVDEVGRI